MEPLELHLKQVADRLKPLKEEFHNAKKQLEHVIDLLQLKDDTSQNKIIQKVEILGDSARETSIVSHIDFECIFYVSLGSDLKNVLKYFVVTLTDNICIQENDITRIPYLKPNSLTFNYRGVEFVFHIVEAEIDEESSSKNNKDILDENTELTEDNKNNEDQEIKSMIYEKQAENILNTYANESDRKTLDLQANSTLQPGYCYLLKQFIEKQKDFSKDIIRLAKYWNQTLIFEKDVEDILACSRLDIVELLALSAAQENESSYLEAFCDFLKKIRDIKSMKILYNSEHVYYKVSDIPCELRTVPPYLVNPGNPHNNLLEGLTDDVDVLQKFSTFAEVTLTRLDQAKHVNKITSGEYDFNKIFEQQPKSYHF